jgi:orotate phosphoribosyltransferase
MEDVVTTGLSSRECIAAIAEEGGVTLAAACLVDRSGGKAELGVPLSALVTLDINNYPADALPPELAAIPAVKPGSRGMK